MSGMCISVVGGNLAPHEVNSAINAIGGLGVASVTGLPIVGEKCQLQGFCINAGQYGAEKCVLEGISGGSEICAVVIHNCTTGIIEDWKPFCELTHMITCVDDVVCFEFNCWDLPGACSQHEEELQFSENPCVKCDQIREAILAFAMGGQKSSEKKGSFSAAYCKAQVEELRTELRYYQKKCRAMCGKSGRRWIAGIRPNCTTL